MEIDHIFICVPPGAAEAEALTALGLTEGSPNRHPGQGTANRRFFFHNMFIELLWLADADEAQSELARPTMLYERLLGAGKDISPFGFCFRPENAEDREVPFTCWQYKPGYLPAHLHVDVASATSLSDPMWFFLEFAGRPDAAHPERRQPLVHQSGVRELTSVRLTLPDSSKLSEAANLAVQSACLEIITGEQHLLELGFDHKAAGDMHDLRPALPLLIEW